MLTRIQPVLTNTNPKSNQRIQSESDWTSNLTNKANHSDNVVLSSSNSLTRRTHRTRKLMPLCLITPSPLQYTAARPNNLPASVFPPAPSGPSTARASIDQSGLYTRPGRGRRAHYRRRVLSPEVWAYFPSAYFVKNADDSLTKTTDNPGYYGQVTSSATPQRGRRLRRVLRAYHQPLLGRCQKRRPAPWSSSIRLQRQRDPRNPSLRPRSVSSPSSASAPARP